MDKQEIIELTNKLYKISLLFPKKEPLRYKVREVGDRILENYIKVFHSSNLSKKDLIFDIEKDIEIIKSYFEVAKPQNWVVYSNILEIIEKYDRIKEHLFEKEFEKEKSEKPEKPEVRPWVKNQAICGGPSSATNLDKRKERILRILKEKEKAQVWEINKVLPQVSKRTLRRDFEHLLKHGLVQRIGQGNNTFYKLIGHR